MLRLTLLAGVGVLALGAATLSPAQASVFSNASSTALTTTPAVISLGSGAATLSFTAASTGYGPGASVATTGSGMITTVFGTVSDFFASSTIDATGLYSFASYATPTQIPFSAADDFIGFSYTASDGTHFGYAEVNGPSLVSYGFESSANTTILTGATGAAAPAPVVGGGGGGGGGGTPVPEPASAALLLGGLAAFGLVRRRGRPGAIAM